MSDTPTHGRSSVVHPAVSCADSTSQLCTQSCREHGCGSFGVDKCLFSLGFRPRRGAVAHVTLGNCQCISAVCGHVKTTAIGAAHTATFHSCHVFQPFICELRQECPHWSDGFALSHQTLETWQGWVTTAISLRSYVRDRNTEEKLFVDRSVDSKLCLVS